MKPVITLTIISLSLFTIVACNAHKKIHDWDGGLISDYGEYFLKKSDLVIQVSHENNMLIYKLLNKRNQTLYIESNDNIGTFNRWDLYWDNQNSRLWIMSSDVGLFVWTLEANNKYKEQAVLPNSELAKQVPKDFLATFPEAYKKLY